MSLNSSNVNYDTTKPIDKVVGIFEGSFSADFYNDGNDDLIWDRRVYGGISYDRFYYPIPHEFGRPVFCELLWSPDQIRWATANNFLSWDDPNLTRVGVTSTAQNIQLNMINFGDSTIYYKVLCYWIDNYDSLNSAITTINQSTKNVTFNSNNNYRRLFSETILTFTSQAVNDTQTETVHHGLGYVPLVIVFHEDMEGFVSGALNRSNSTISWRPDEQTNIELTVDESDVYINWLSPEQGRATNRRVWVRIYEGEV